MEQAGSVVATVTTISYQGRFAWIGMVLVDPEFRKQGIGTRLLEHAIEYLDQSHIATMKLDATPLGKPLYEKFGFVTEYEIERWILKQPSPLPSMRGPSEVRLLNTAPLDEVLECDQELFGANRDFLVRSLHDQAPAFALGIWENGFVQGYGFGRRGLFADHLGPWMATNRDAAEQILQAFLAVSRRETIVVDSLTANAFTIDLLKGYGFARSRPLTRMFRGSNQYPGKPERLCAILGPEFG
jgi:predicted GNAT family acetyltransferase